MAVDEDSDDFPSFYKIILSPKDELQKLGIPIKFMTDYGNDLLNVVSLKIPTGKTWNVELVKENGRAWFQDGWPEFVNHYSICHGHFLMFTYVGNSQFNVFIFDMSASEIEYPFHPPETSETPTKVSETKARVISTSPRPSAKGKRLIDLVKLKIQKFGTCTRNDIKKINSKRLKKPSFAVIMQPAYMESMSRMHVPVAFANEYLRNTKGMSVMLENPTGDTWLVKCAGKTPRSREFSEGWKEFALGNKLRVGDICVFETMDVIKRLFKVEIVRRAVVEVAAPSDSNKSPSVKVEVICIDD